MYRLNRTKLRIVPTLLLLTIYITQVHAQQKASSKTNGIAKDISQSLIAHWKNGEIKTYSITHTIVKSEDGKRDSTTFTYWANVKVVDSSSEGYKLQWNYILPPSSLNIPHANDIYEFYKGLNILFETNATGEFRGVSNWQELRDHYVKMFELSIPPKKNGEVDSALEKVKQMFNSRQIVEGAMAKEITLLLQGYGNSFSANGDMVNTSLPNPFSPVKPIPALLSTKLSELNPKLNYFKVLITQTINKEDALELFESVFDKMGLPKDSVMTKAKEMLNDFEINDHCEIKAVISSGWISSMQYSRTVNSEMLAQKESYLIEEKK